MGRAGVERRAAIAAVWIGLAFASAQAAAGQTSMDGLLEVEGFVFTERSRLRPERARGEALLRLKLEHGLGNGFSLLAIPRIEVGTSEFYSGVVDFLDADDEKRPILDVEEWYGEYLGERVGVRIGKQIYKWGMADGINPTDRLSARDIFDLVDDRDIGVLSGKLSVFLSPRWTLEAVFVPFFTPYRIAHEDYRYSFVPFDSPITLNDRRLPDRSASSFQGGLRLVGFGLLNGVDVSLVAYDGIDHVPAGLIEEDGTVSLLYPKIRVVGGNLAFNTGSFGWRAEAALAASDHGRTDSTFQLALGVDRRFANVISDHALYALVQYVRLTVVDDAGLPVNEELSQAFNNTLVFVVRYELSEFTRGELRATVNLDRGDHLVEMRVEHEIRPGVTVHATLDLLGGAQSTFFGQFRDDDRFRLGVAWAF